MSKKLVAVKYSKNFPAPLILAKFRGHHAERAERLARDHGIAVRHESWLANQLFTLPEGTWIPEEYFEIMARILSVVYEMNKGGEDVHR